MQCEEGPLQHLAQKAWASRDRNATQHGGESQHWTQELFFRALSDAFGLIGQSLGQAVLR